MYKYQNKKATLNGKNYELFWVTDFAQHIMERKDHHSHRIDLRQIELYATGDIFWSKEGSNWFGLFKYNGKYYQIVAYFIDVPKRCVIKTCHIVNSMKILDICKTLNI
jgi:hypothetical protein